MSQITLRPAAMAALVAAVGCSSDTTPVTGQPDAAVAQPDAVSSMPDLIVSLPDAAIPQPDATVALPDAGMPDVGSPDASAPDAAVPVATICDDLGLQPMPFATGTGDMFGDVAGDFTVNLLDGGTWDLQSHYTGCESYIFVNFVPTQGGTFETAYWGSDFAELLDDAPLNAHFFFTSLEPTAAAREARVRNMSLRVNLLLDGRYRNDPEGKAQQLARFHFVTDATSEIAGSVGAFTTSYLAYLPNSAVDIGADRGFAPALPPFVFGIDRDQRWDAGGSVQESVGGSPRLRMTAYLPQFYNHKAEIRDRVAGETGIDTFPLLDERVTDRIFEQDVALPDAAAMASYDTMEFDVSVNCPHRNNYSCSEWDRIARIEVCPDGRCSCSEEMGDPPECTAGDKRREVIRWITPYWRRGERRWIVDASSLLPLVEDGGTTRFRIVTGPSWERATPRDIRIHLRLSNQSQPDRPTGALLAYKGGSFNDTYNDREPFGFTPPATATRVEVITILSGHGQDQATNCAEWCDHRHEYRINGALVADIRPVGRIFDLEGCTAAAAQGVPPGQGGNWAPLRAYWCPGLPVEHIRTDITNEVTLGQENLLTYQANLAGQFTPRGGNIDLSVYVVWYE